jgi:hypothetical protein
MEVTPWESEKSALRNTTRTPKPEPGTTPRASSKTLSLKPPSYLIIKRQSIGRGGDPATARRERPPREGRPRELGSISARARKRAERERERARARSAPGALVGARRRPSPWRPASRARARKKDRSPLGPAPKTFLNPRGRRERAASTEAPRVRGKAGRGNSPVAPPAPGILSFYVRGAAAGRGC